MIIILLIIAAAFVLWAWALGKAFFALGWWP